MICEVPLQTSRTALIPYTNKRGTFLTARQSRGSPDARSF